MEYWNGLNANTLFKGKDNELEATGYENLLNETHTNGMQFRPMLNN